MGLLQSAALAGALLLPFAFFLYVSHAGEWCDNIVSPPWLRAYARRDHRIWDLSAFTGLLLCVLTVAWYSAGVG